MRVLIVKTSSMGDVVHALPAISDMARCVPGIEIDWLVEKSFSAMPGQHRAVKRVIPLQWRKWRKSLRSQETRAALRNWRHEMARDRYDLIISDRSTHSLHSSTGSPSASRCSGRPATAGGPAG